MEILRFAQDDGLTARDDGLIAQDDGLTAQGDGLTARDDGLAARDDGLAARDDRLKARGWQCALLVALGLLVGNHAWAQTQSHREGLWKLDPPADHRKILAAYNPGALAYGDGLLVASFDKRWIGAYQFKERRVAWWHAADTGLTIPPKIIGGAVLVAERNSALTKISLSSGKVAWKTTLDAFASRPPVAKDGVLLVQSAAQVLSAVDMETGTIRWIYDAGFPEDLRVQGDTAPIIVGDTVIFGLASGELAAVRIADGQQVFKLNPKVVDGRFHDYVGSFAIEDGHLLISRYDGLVGSMALDGSASLRWQNKLTGLTTATQFAGRHCVATLAGDIVCFDSRSGQQLWRQTSGVPVAYLLASEKILYVAGSNGHILALDITDGSIRWYDDIGGPLHSPPVVVDRRLLLATGLRVIYSFRH